VTKLHWDILGFCVIVAVFVAICIRARPDRWSVFQFIVSVIGAILFMVAWHAGPGTLGSSDAALPILAVVVGYWVNKGVMFLIIWARFGRASARSMRLLD
jgi:hypothetical protein